MINAVIFDLDGVLVFTDKYHYLAWKKIADEENIYFDEVINNRLRGVSRMESLNIILSYSDKKYSEEEKIVLANRKNEIYKEYLKQLSKNDISDDIIFTLNALKEKGVLLAIGSSSKNTIFILKQTEIYDYFDVIVDGNNISNSKPHPEVFLKAKDLLRLNVDECIVIEDAKAGIDAAYAGGFKSVGINDAFGYKKATYSIRSVKEVLNYV